MEKQPHRGDGKTKWDKRGRMGQKGMYIFCQLLIAGSQQKSIY